jgi:hypothetical protein
VSNPARLSHQDSSTDRMDWHPGYLLFLILLPPPARPYFPRFPAFPGTPLLPLPRPWSDSMAACSHGFRQAYRVGCRKTAILVPQTGQ